MIGQLTPRQELLESISDRLCDALQADFEHGVASLSSRAAADFKRTYPELWKTLQWIHQMHMDEAD
jgi:hypothetical protein